MFASTAEAARPKKVGSYDPLCVTKCFAPEVNKTLVKSVAALTTCACGTYRVIGEFLFVFLLQSFRLFPLTRQQFLDLSIIQPLSHCKMSVSVTLLSESELR